MRDDKPRWYKWYSKENSYARKQTRRKHRREGKKYLDDAPPEKGTQGWMTY